jgi:hypothetical protein
MTITDGRPTLTTVGQHWRLDQLDDGTAWLYTRTAPGVWHQANPALLTQWYAVTSSPEAVNDDELGACVRYRLLRIPRERRWSPIR